VGVEILLTNDDGIGTPGLEALRDALADVGDVTVVAPAEDQSAVGRAVSGTVTIREHDHGFVVEGTPSDAVLAGLDAIEIDPDLVVAGCNRGANVGAYVLGRSGTVLAAVEAAFYGVPAMAVSLWVPTPDGVDFESVTVEREAYAVAADAARYLAREAPGTGIFEGGTYLNLNAPVPDRHDGTMAVTRPSHAHDVTAIRDGDTVHLRNDSWSLMEQGADALPDPEGTDRHAVVAGRVSVSPLRAPHATNDHPAFDALAGAYGSRDSNRTGSPDGSVSP
jgi:5'-nucleotidase